MKKFASLALIVAIAILSACGSDPYASEVPEVGDFQLTVNQRGVSLVAHNANLKEVLQQISEKTSRFAISGDGERFVTDSFENLAPKQAIERLLSRNYGLVTDQDGNSVVAVFIASDKPTTDDSTVSLKSESLANNVALIPSDTNVSYNDVYTEPHREVDDNIETVDPPVPEEALVQVREITFSDPIPISGSNHVVEDLRTQGEVPTQFIISFGDYQSLYEIGEGETISSVFDREKPEMLAMLDQQKESVLVQPASEFTTKTIQMIENGRSALLSGNITLKSVGVQEGK